MSFADGYFPASFSGGGDHTDTRLRGGAHLTAPNLARAVINAYKIRKDLRSCFASKPWRARQSRPASKVEAKCRSHSPPPRP